MTQKESAIRIIPKPKPRAPLWINFLLGTSLFLLLAVLLVFFFLAYEESSLGKRNDKLDTEIAKLEKSDIKAIERELMKTSKKLKDFSQIFQQHKRSSELFGFFEHICHPRAQFLSFNFLLDGYVVNLEAVTENFKTLGEQLLLLEDDLRIKSFELSNVAINEEGQVGFGLSLSLSEFLFTR